MKLSKGMWNESSKFLTKRLKIALLSDQVTGLTQAEEVLFYTMQNVTVNPLQQDIVEVETENEFKERQVQGEPIL